MYRIILYYTTIIIRSGGGGEEGLTPGAVGDAAMETARTVHFGLATATTNR